MFNAFNLVPDPCKSISIVRGKKNGKSIMSVQVLLILDCFLLYTLNMKLHGTSTLSTSVIPLQTSL